MAENFAESYEIEDLSPVLLGNHRLLFRMDAPNEVSPSVYVELGNDHLRDFRALMASIIKLIDSVKSDKEPIPWHRFDEITLSEKIGTREGKNVLTALMNNGQVNKGQGLSDFENIKAITPPRQIQNIVARWLAQAALPAWLK